MAFRRTASRSGARDLGEHGRDATQVAVKEAKRRERVVRRGRRGVLDSAYRESGRDRQGLAPPVVWVSSGSLRA